MLVTPNSDLILDQILDANLPQASSLALSHAHGVWMERMVQKTEVTSLLADVTKQGQPLLGAWEAVILADVDGQGMKAFFPEGQRIVAGEPSPIYYLWDKLLEMPDEGTVYGTGGLSVSPMLWQSVCPGRMVQHFAVYFARQEGRPLASLVLFSETKAELAEHEQRIAELLVQSVEVLIAPRNEPLEEEVSSANGGTAPDNFLDQPEYVQALISMMNQGVAVLDDEGVITYANSEAAGAVGLPEEQFIGESIFRFSTGIESNDRLRSLFQATDSSTEDVCLRHQSGSKVWARIDGRRLPAKGVEPARVLAVFKDVTAELQSQASVDYAKDCLEAVANLSGSVVFHVDRRGVVTSVDGDDLSDDLRSGVGEPVWNWCPDRTQRRRLWRQLLRTDQANGTIVNPLGQFEIGLKARKDGFGKVASVQGVAVKQVMTPVAEQEMLPEVLPPPPAAQAASPQAILPMLHVTQDAIVVLDSRGIVSFVNSAAETLFGMPLGQLERRLITDVCAFQSTDNTSLSLTQILEAVIQGAASQVIPGQLRCPNHAVVEVDFKAAPIKSEEDVILGAVLCCRPKQDRNEDAAGTAPMSERQQLQAENIKMLSTFAGGIAHDFNNILTSLVGNVSLANMLVTKIPEASERLVEAERACFRAKDLSHQLLTFSKGSTPVKKEVRLEDLIQQCVEFYLRGSKAIPRVQVKDDLWSVNADEGQISQVLENLIINADHSMPHGGTISISCENVKFVAADSATPLVLDDGLYVKVCVTDEGAGIPAEQLPHIFKPYFTANENGRGLGLATTYAIIKNHSGRITAVSSPGLGTEFTIYLPATGVTKDPEADNGRNIMIRAGRTGEPAGKVLVVDDEKSIRDLADTTLRLMGCEVATCPSSSEGVQQFIQAKRDGKPFHLVIMDLTLPGDLCGNEAMQQILSVCPDARGVASSGYSEGSVMSHFREYGFQAALSKPYNIADLQRVVATMLEG